MTESIEQIEARLEAADFNNRHASVTAERVVEMVEAAISDMTSPGICLGCGQDADGVEPDARRYRCEDCRENKVYGAE